MKCLRTLLLIGMLVVVACTDKEKEIKRILESPIEYSSHMSPYADFTQYVSWDWVPVSPDSPTDPRAEDPQLRRDIEEAVSRQMEIRGYEKTSDNAQMAVNYHLAVQTIDQEYIRAMYDGKYLPAYRIDFSGPRSARRKWEEGSLIVFVFDTSSREMLWRGSAKAEVTEGAPHSERVRRLSKVAQSMFTSLPGRPRFDADSN